MFTNWRTLDLQDAQAPEDVAKILRNAADKYREDASMLNGSWGDDGAGKPWLEIARKLEALANKLP